MFACVLLSERVLEAEKMELTTIRSVAFRWSVVVEIIGRDFVLCSGVV